MVKRSEAAEQAPGSAEWLVRQKVGDHDLQHKPVQAAQLLSKADSRLLRRLFRLADAPMRAHPEARIYHKTGAASWAPGRYNGLTDAVQEGFGAPKLPSVICSIPGRELGLRHQPD